MNPDTLIAVHCYAGDRERLERLFPLWLHHERPVLLLSPENAPVYIKEDDLPMFDGQRYLITCRAAGGNGWIGTQVPHRLLKHWRIALEYDADWFFLNEWDSFCMTPELPQELYEDDDLFWSIEVDETWATGNVTSGLRFSFPYFMSRKMLLKLVKAGEEIIEDVTAGPDLPLYGNMSPDGFTVHVIKKFGLRHRNYTDAYDSRAGADGNVPRIIHWHALTDPNLPLLAAGYLGGE